MTIYYMRKLYIQPTIEVEEMGTLDIIADSGKVKGDDVILGSVSDNENIDDNLTSSDGSDIGLTKSRRSWFSDDSYGY